MLGQQLFLNCHQLAMDLKTWQKSAKILSENQSAIWNYKKKGTYTLSLFVNFVLCIFVLVKLIIN